VGSYRHTTNLCLHIRDRLLGTNFNAHQPQRRADAEADFGHVKTNVISDIDGVGLASEEEWVT
jgi:hypothetical protein